MFHVDATAETTTPSLSNITNNISIPLGRIEVINVSLCSNVSQFEFELIGTFYMSEKEMKYLIYNVL